MSLKQFIELITVCILFTILLFSPLITTIIFITLSCFWSFPITFTLFLIYGCWVYYDRNTASQGGRWSDWLRRLSIMKPFVNYFPLKLIKTENLDPNQNYIFGYHPHGSFSFGAMGSFATDALSFSTLFPNIRPHLTTLFYAIMCPFTREIVLNLGVCSVSKESCEYLLSGKAGQGHALVIVIGGVREQSLAKNDTMLLYLKNRKGFIRLALQYGASLVPVIAFGENELYRRINPFNFMKNGLPWGRFIFGHVPLRHPVVTVVGKPIRVNQNIDPTMNEIDQLHGEYIQAVEELFEMNKNNYECGHIKLEIV